MGDILIFFVWMAGLVLSVVVIVAQCQLFAIRRLLEALVKQSGAAPVALCNTRVGHNREVCGHRLVDHAPAESDPDRLFCKRCGCEQWHADQAPVAAERNAGADPGLPPTITTEPAARSRGVERALYIGLALAIFAVVAWVVLH
jgi:hypothetical protein